MSFNRFLGENSIHNTCSSLTFNNFKKHEDFHLYKDEFAYFWPESYIVIFLKKNTFFTLSLSS